MKIEHLNVDFEVKSTDEDDEFFHLKGYASTFGNVDHGKDIVMKGAFLNSIEKFNQGTKKVKVLWQHNHKEPIGVPILLKEDSKGLYIEAKMPKADSFINGRVVPQIKIGSVDSMSIGYRIDEDEIKDGVRFLKQIDLMEFSLVTTPMNDQAVITSFKSIDVEELDKINIRTLEKQLVNGVKFSKNASKKLIFLIKDGLQREAVNQQRDVEEMKKISDIINKEFERKIQKIKKWRN